MTELHQGMDYAEKLTTDEILEHRQMIWELLRSLNPDIQGSLREQWEKHKADIKEIALVLRNPHNQKDQKEQLAQAIVKRNKLKMELNRTRYWRDKYRTQLEEFGIGA